MLLRDPAISRLQNGTSNPIITGCWCQGFFIFPGIPALPLFNAYNGMLPAAWFGSSNLLSQGSECCP